MGRGYVIEHCVSTLNAIRQEENYRIYLTEVLRAISKGIGYEIKVGYADILQRSEMRQSEPERSPEEIVNAIKAKAELINNGTVEPCGESHT